MPDSVAIDMMFIVVFLFKCEILYSTLKKSIASNIYLRGY